MKQLLFGIFILVNLTINSQVVTGELEEPIFHAYKDNIYTFNLEDKKVFHIRKYDLNLNLLSSYDKKMEKSISGNWAVSFSEKDIVANFAYNKIKISFKQKPVPGCNLSLDFDLKEMSSQVTEDLGYFKPNYVLYNQSNVRRPKTSYNSFNEENYEKEVKQKNNIKQIGPMLSLQNTNNNKQTFQIANFKDEVSERFYNGFFVLTEEEGKAVQFKKFEFLNFENIKKEQNTFMEFYPYLVKDNGKSFLIPFSQKIHRRARKYSNISQTSEEIDAYYIIGIGVLELNKTDGSIQYNIYDRKGHDKDLMEEYIVDFEGKDLNQYTVLLRNLYNELSTYNKTCWSVYNQTGEKLKECDKNKVYYFTNKGYYIFFNIAKKGYTLEKVNY